jgi:NADH:ubiquinone oxidoreductase subunit H
MATWALGTATAASWALACLKVVFVFCAIVMVRICTPRFGLGALGRLAWGSLLMYLLLFFLVYACALVWL